MVSVSLSRLLGDSEIELFLMRVGGHSRDFEQHEKKWQRTEACTLTVLSINSEQSW